MAVVCSHADWNSTTFGVSSENKIDVSDKIGDLERGDNPSAFLPKLSR
jgi:hypothetical protein